jgi:formylglycine-generating enzyme required for sulfatase activity
MELVRVPAGEFLMGSNPAFDKYAGRDDQPQHTVELPEFYIGRYEVTNGQYIAFVKATGHRTPPYWGTDTVVASGKENRPAVWVSWDDAALFAQWLSDQTGMDFRLPNEAEWEKACRGTDGRLYPWDDDAPDAGKANYRGHVDSTTQVGSYSPQGDSPYGVADMAGNVWEWTSSLFRDLPYSVTDGREDMKARGRRVMRGGAFYWGDEKSVRCTERDSQWMVERTFLDNDVGFRVVLHP